MKRKKISGILASTLAASVLLVASMTVCAATTAHKVVSGDNLWTIAKKYNTSPSAIARANGISEKALLKLGDKLVIPCKASAKSKASKVVSSGGGYTVRQGDTLWAIAKRLGTSPASLAKANGISEKSVLQLGDKLIIPGKQTVSARKPNPKVAKATAAKKKAVCSRRTESAPKKAKLNNGNTTVVRTALAYCGTRYRRGGTSRGGFDCSGFVRYVYSKYGLKLPHSSAAQARLGTSVSKSELKAGDLVFFQTNGRGISHVGIYIGNGNFVHASNQGRGVTTDSLSSSYYAPRYKGAKRVK